MKIKRIRWRKILANKTKKAFSFLTAKIQDFSNFNANKKLCFGL